MHRGFRKFRIILLQYVAEFVCDDAVVIPLNQKCDGNNDCPESPWMRPGGKTRDEGIYACQPEGK